jgi:two-component system, NarL family, invasion response regulator UvrY
MYDDENAIIRMLRNGAKGYILKDSDPSELKTALRDVSTKGFYHSDLVTGTLIHTLNHLDDPENASLREGYKLNEREIEVLKYMCTELTYKEIADQMHVSPRTVDGYRDSLLEKLECKSRVGLVLFAIRQGLVIV